MKIQGILLITVGLTFALWMSWGLYSIYSTGRPPYQVVDSLSSQVENSPVRTTDMDLHIARDRRFFLPRSSFLYIWSQRRKRKSGHDGTGDYCGQNVLYFARGPLEEQRADARWTGNGFHHSSGASIGDAAIFLVDIRISSRAKDGRATRYPSSPWNRHKG
jgi:hypothetical protein